MDLLSWPSSPLIFTFSLTIFALSRGKFQKSVIFSIWVCLQFKHSELGFYRMLKIKRLCTNALFVSQVFTGLHSHLSTNATTLYGQEFSQMRAAQVSAAPDSSSRKTRHARFRPRPAGLGGSGLEPAATSTDPGPVIAPPATAAPATPSVTAPGPPRRRP